jgi:hypothetical protein
MEVFHGKHVNKWDSSEQVSRSCWTWPTGNPLARDCYTKDSLPVYPWQTQALLLE